MKMSDNYTREDVLELNFLMFMTSMIMLVVCTIAHFMGVL